LKVSKSLAGAAGFARHLPLCAEASALRRVGVHLVEVVLDVAEKAFQALEKLGGIDHRSVLKE